MWPIAPFVPKCQRIATNSVGGASLSWICRPNRRPNCAHARVVASNAASVTRTLRLRLTVRCPRDQAAAPAAPATLGARHNAAPLASVHLFVQAVERHLHVEVLPAELLAHRGFDVGLRLVGLDLLRD